MKCSWDGHEKCKNEGTIFIKGHGHYCIDHITEMAWMYLDLQD